MPGRRPARISGNCPRYIMNLLQGTDMTLPVLDEEWAGPSWEPGVWKEAPLVDQMKDSNNLEFDGGDSEDGNKNLSRVYT